MVPTTFWVWSWFAYQLRMDVKWTASQWKFVISTNFISPYKIDKKTAAKNHSISMFPHLNSRKFLWKFEWILSVCSENALLQISFTFPYKWYLLDREEVAAVVVETISLAASTNKSRFRSIIHFHFHFSSFVSYLSLSFRLNEELIRCLQQYFLWFSNYSKRFGFFCLVSIRNKVLQTWQFFKLNYGQKPRQRLAKRYKIATLQL